MLSRAADNLYWLARYIERAENTARLLDVTYRMALLPGTRLENVEWGPALAVSPASRAFKERYAEPTAENVIRFMVVDSENPSSIQSCLRAARENARRIRPSITTEMWEAINDTWLGVRDLGYDDVRAKGLRDFFGWVKERAHLLRGVTDGTLLRRDSYLFVRLGTYVERADNTARLLDVKYHVLLPSTEEIGGALDYYQWGALLRSLSGLSAYRRLYQNVIAPWQVADFLIFRPEMPRSLRFCLDRVENTLQQLGGPAAAECRRLAGELRAKILYGRIDDAFRVGLHEFLMDFIARTDRLDDEINKGFMMTVARDQRVEAAGPVPTH